MPRSLQSEIVKLNRILNGGNSSNAALNAPISQLLLNKYSSVEKALNADIEVLKDITNSPAKYLLNLAFHQTQQLELYQQALKNQPLTVDLEAVKIYCETVHEITAQNGLRAIFVDKNAYYLDDAFITKQETDMRFNANLIYTQVRKSNATGVIISYRENSWLENIEADKLYYQEKYQQLKSCLNASDINFLGLIICDEGFTQIYSH